jgi:hypothetical protein
MAGKTEHKPIIEAGLEIGITLQPAPYESLRVSASFRKEGLAEEGSGKLWAEVQKEVEDHLAEVLKTTLEGYQELKKGQ